MRAAFTLFPVTHPVFSATYSVFPAVCIALSSAYTALPGTCTVLSRAYTVLPGAYAELPGTYAELPSTYAELPSMRTKLRFECTERPSAYRTVLADYQSEYLEPSRAVSSDPLFTSYTPGAAVGLVASGSL